MIQLQQVAANLVLHVSLNPLSLKEANEKLEKKMDTQEKELDIHNCILDL